MAAPKPPVQTPDSESLPFALARTALCFRRFNDETLRLVGLKGMAPGQASVLHAMTELGDCTVKQLAGATQLPNGTLSGLLDTLEQEALLKRLPNPEDGRSWMLVLTAKGRKVCGKLAERHRLVLGIFDQSFSKAERSELARLLAKANACMGTPMETRGTAPKRPRAPKA